MYACMYLTMYVCIYTHILLQARLREPELYVCVYVFEYVCMYTHILMQARLREPEFCRYSVLFDMSGASIKNVDYPAVNRFVQLCEY